MILTATLLTVLAISGISYLLSKIRNGDQEAGEEDEVQKAVIKFDQQNQAGGSDDTERAGENRDSAQTAIKQEAAEESAAKGEPARSSAESKSERNVTGTSAASREQGETISSKPIATTLESDPGKQEPPQEVSQVQQQKKPGKVKRRPISECLKGGAKPEHFAFQHQKLRDSSPKRPRDRRGVSCGVPSGDCEKTCPVSSPVSGRGYSYGYTVANQAPCDPFCPRLY